MRRREFIVGGAATSMAFPLAARAQQPALPVVGFVSPNSTASRLAAFRKGLGESGYVEGQNVTVEYHWLEGHFDQLPAVMADLVRRQVAVIAAPGTVPGIAAKAATSTIPVVFGASEDPVRLGLVSSLARPGGNATGSNFFVEEVAAKRMRLLHDLVPKAVRIAVLVNPANATSTRTTLKEVQEAAPTIGWQTRILNASTTAEIDAAFAGFAHDHPDALFVGGDGLFDSNAPQLTALAARDKIPATYDNRHYLESGGLMSYGTDLTDMWHQIGVYTGQILTGAKPADLPVVQSTKFELALNLKTAKALGIEVPPTLLALADEVIE